MTEENKTIPREVVEEQGLLAISTADEETYREVEQIVIDNPQMFGELLDESQAISTLKTYLNIQIGKFNEKPHLKAKSLGELVITLTETGFDTMEFLLRKQLTREQRKTQQEWLGVPKEQEEEMAHEIRVRTLAKLLKDEPLRVPGWDALNKSKSLEERFIDLFTDEEYESVIDHLNTL